MTASKDHVPGAGAHAFDALGQVEQLDRPGIAGHRAMRLAQRDRIGPSIRMPGQFRTDGPRHPAPPARPD
ncbi:MAG: hypothetical protein ABH877_03460, partial [bacterium]